MANYTQFISPTGSSSPGGTTQGQRVLDNGSDYLGVRVSQYETLYVQGVLDRENNVISYSGDSWVYNSHDNTFTYRAADLGRVTVSDDIYVYSSLPGYQRLSVADVFPRYCFMALFALILLLIGFNVIKKRWIL